MSKWGVNACPLGSQTEAERNDTRKDLYTATLAAQVNVGRMTHREALMRIRDGCKKRPEFEDLRERYQKYLR